MSASVRPIIPWDDVDTVMVDMDGTLLDLAFDNFFWQELVPECYARHRNLPEEEARRELLGRYQALEGQLEWYCIDHWSEVLGLDIRALKWEYRHRIQYLPGAIEFLEAVRRRGKRLLLVTNAHRETLAVKVAQTGLDLRVDEMISSHDYRAPKQSQLFWQSLRASEDFDPERTVLIEDSLSVLKAASEFGLKFMVAIRCPDSGQPPRQISSFASVDGVRELSQ